MKMDPSMSSEPGSELVNMPFWLVPKCCDA